MNDQLASPEAARSQWNITDFPIVMYVLLFFFIISIFFPRQAWWLDGGWWSNSESEPSSTKLFLRRLGGIIGTCAIIYALQRK